MIVIGKVLNYLRRVGEVRVVADIVSKYVTPKLSSNSPTFLTRETLLLRNSSSGSFWKLSMFLLLFN